MKKIFQYVVLTGCLILIVWHFYIHRNELSILKSLTFLDILLLGFLFILLNVIVTLKIYLILKALEIKDLTFFSWFRICIISRFVNFYLAQGANIYRSIKLKQHHDFSYSNSIGIILFLGWLELIIFLIISLVFIVFSPSSYANRWVLPALGISLITLILAPLAARKLLSGIKSTNTRIMWIGGKLTELTTTAFVQIKRRSAMIAFTFLAVLTFAFTVLVIHYSFHALNVPFSLLNTCLYTLVMVFSRYVNIIPGNIGLSELMCGYFADALGYTMGSGIIVSSLFRLMDFLVIALMALFFQIERRYSFNDFRKMDELKNG